MTEGDPDLTYSWDVEPFRPNANAEADAETLIQVTKIVVSTNEDHSRWHIMAQEPNTSVGLMLDRDDLLKLLAAIDRLMEE